MKKIFSLCFSLIIVFGASVPALAQSRPPVRIMGELHEGDLSLRVQFNPIYEEVELLVRATSRQNGRDVLRDVYGRHLTQEETSSGEAELMWVRDAAPLAAGERVRVLMSGERREGRRVEEDEFQSVDVVVGGQEQLFPPQIVGELVEDQNSVNITFNSNYREVALGVRVLSEGRASEVTSRSATAEEMRQGRAQLTWRGHSLREDDQVTALMWARIREGGNLGRAQSEPVTVGERRNIPEGNNGLPPNANLSVGGQPRRIQPNGDQQIGPDIPRRAFDLARIFGRHRQEPPALESPIIREPVTTVDREVRGTMPEEISAEFQLYEEQVRNVAVRPMPAPAPLGQGHGENGEFIVTLNPDVHLAEGQRIFVAMTVENRNPVRSNPPVQVQAALVEPGPIPEPILEPEPEPEPTPEPLALQSPRIEDPVRAGHRVIHASYQPSDLAGASLTLSLYRNNRWEMISDPTPGNNGWAHIALRNNENLDANNRIKVGLLATGYDENDRVYSDEVRVGALPELVRPEVAPITAGDRTIEGFYDRSYASATFVAHRLRGGEDTVVGEQIIFPGGGIFVINVNQDDLQANDEVYVTMTARILLDDPERTINSDPPQSVVEGVLPPLEEPPAFRIIPHAGDQQVRGAYNSAYSDGFIKILLNGQPDNGEEGQRVESEFLIPLSRPLVVGDRVQLHLRAATDARGPREALGQEIVVEEAPVGQAMRVNPAARRVSGRTPAPQQRQYQAPEEPQRAQRYHLPEEAMGRTERAEEVPSPEGRQDRRRIEQPGMNLPGADIPAGMPIDLGQQDKSEEKIIQKRAEESKRELEGKRRREEELENKRKLDEAKAKAVAEEESKKRTVEENKKQAEQAALKVKEHAEAAAAAKQKAEEEAKRKVEESAKKAAEKARKQAEFEAKKQVNVDLSISEKDVQYDPMTNTVTAVIWNKGEGVAENIEISFYLKDEFIATSKTLDGTEWVKEIKGKSNVTVKYKAKTVPGLAGLVEWMVEVRSVKGEKDVGNNKAAIKGKYSP